MRAILGPQIPPMAIPVRNLRTIHCAHVLMRYIKPVPMPNAMRLNIRANFSPLFSATTPMRMLPRAAPTMVDEAKSPPSARLIPNTLSSTGIEIARTSRS
jgi:hypothetical protein